jgi:flavin reductase (DIM6/NTAB) family NADH-FMN oxidoreductase RutF
MEENVREIYYDMDDLKCDINYRWIQPPQIAYFVTTIDAKGNINVTPVTLGTLVCAQLPRGDKPSEYYFTFSLGCVDLDDEGNKLQVRHGHLNLQEVPECVISYIGYDLLYESAVTGLPIPRGISELDVAGLTPLPSKKVRPCGIKECPVNMEAKVVSSQKIGSYYVLYLCKIVGVSVNAEYVRRDKELMDGLGIFAIDPLFEVSIRKGNTDNIRLYYARLDKNKVHRTPDDIGCFQDWVGHFDKWMRDEVKRGSITEQECEEILKLNEEWQKNRDPVANAEVKKKLTEKLKAICLKTKHKYKYGY